MSRTQGLKAWIIRLASGLYESQGVSYDFQGFRSTLNMHGMRV